MKRIYLAIALILFSVIIGTIEFNTINNKADRYIDSISEIGDYVKTNQIKKAEKLCEETAESFDNYSKNVLYCYYEHDKLEELTESFYSLEDLLDDKRIEDYHEMSHSLKEKLLSLKGKEQITIQNIL